MVRERHGELEAIVPSFSVSDLFVQGISIWRISSWLHVLPFAYVLHYLSCSIIPPKSNYIVTLTSEVVIL